MPKFKAKPTPGQLSFWPKHWPTQRQREVGLAAIGDIRRRMGWDKPQTQNKKEG